MSKIEHHFNWSVEQLLGIHDGNSRLLHPIEGKGAETHKAQIREVEDAAAEAAKNPLKLNKKRQLSPKGIVFKLLPVSR